MGRVRRLGRILIDKGYVAEESLAAALAAQLDLPYITGCTITYDQNVVNQRNGIVSIWLRLADPAGGTIVSLFQQVQVSNLP